MFHLFPKGTDKCIIVKLQRQKMDSLELTFTAIKISYLNYSIQIPKIYNSTHFILKKSFAMCSTGHCRYIDYSNGSTGNTDLAQDKMYLQEFISTW